MLAVFLGKYRAWWTFFRVSIEERLVYRGDFALGTLMRFLPIVTQIFLWFAIFDAIGNSESDEISGYKYRDMVAYYLLVMVSRAFSSMPNLTNGIATQIQTGEIKKFLIQPIDMIGCLLVQRVAHKLVYYSIAIIPFALVFFLCRSFFVDGWPNPTVMTAFVASLLIAFLIGYFVECCIGLIGFWFLEVTSITFIYMLLSFFLSGHMFPLDLLPKDPVNWQALIDFLPLKYLAFVPAAIFLGKIGPDEMMHELLIGAGWIVFFVVLARIMWWRGVNRYSGFGG